MIITFHVLTAYPLLMNVVVRVDAAATAVLLALRVPLSLLANDQHAYFVALDSPAGAPVPNPRPRARILGVAQVLEIEKALNITNNERHRNAFLYRTMVRVAMVTLTVRFTSQRLACAPIPHLRDPHRYRR